MGLGYAFNQLVHGNFENAFNGVWVSDDMLAAPDQTASALEQTWQRQAAEGLIDQQQAIDLNTALAPNSNSTAFWEAGGGNTPFNEFQSSLEESASSIGQFGSRAINRTLGLGARLIPWQVYVLLFIVLLIWLAPIWKPFFDAFLKKGK
jgi:hypothetical protein